MAEPTSSEAALKGLVALAALSALLMLAALYAIFVRAPMWERVECARAGPHIAHMEATTSFQPAFRRVNAGDAKGLRSTADFLGMKA